ncbi:PREDICTED: uncharacterized protein LOC109149078 [Ipomoea nil]|uniref:uncharacterized protein LOC109149078 n=1 Tax=Ipomoea nil TaxID=35883 RepID=UPI000901FCF7|nr:PREDICTED: uncharacterized protein LOC109149078 [Ipomoea nil]
MELGSEDISQPPNQTQSVGSSQPSTTSTIIKRKSNDVGWDYGVLNDPTKSLDKIKCLLCKKVMSGGVYRIKEHIAGISGNNKRAEELNIRAEVNIGSHESLSNTPTNSIDVDELQESEQMRPPRPIGPMDKFANQINPEISLSSRRGPAQQRIIEAFDKEMVNRVKEYICRWAYEAAVPFHVLEKDSFKLMIEAAGQLGPGAQTPNRYELSETYLKKEVDRVKDSLKEHEALWKQNGCSIMTDAWTDRKRRSVMNLCVNSRLGTVFLSFKECSSEAHTSQFIFEYVEHGIKEVGENNVVQIVIDNAANNMGAAKLLKEKRPRLFWTCCATHSINLMLESIAGLPRFKKVLDQAKSLTIFIYAHHKTLAMMRTYTKKCDIIRPGVTRFASAFLTLQSLLAKKIELKAMFSSNEWEECKFANTIKGKASYATVTNTSFWQGVTLCLNVFAPLVKVLRIVDQDKKPSMGFVYGELMQAKEDIKKALNEVVRNYEPIIKIVEEKMSNRLDSPLHLMAFMLNPYYHFKDPRLHLNVNVSLGCIEFLETYYHDDLEMQNKVLNDEFPIYKRKDGVFGKTLAVKGCETNNERYDLAMWWSTYGGTTLNLQTIAIKILSLTSSSSGCERNWSTFEGIHTKKRNKLESNRLNNLVFVQFNANLMNKRKKEQNVEILLSSDATFAQDWIVEDEVEVVGEDEVATNEEGDDALRPRRSSRLRELEEDNFESESEEEEVVVEFEDDENQVIDGQVEEQHLES